MKSKKNNNKKELHDKCMCKDCKDKREMTKLVLDSWVKAEAGRIAREIIYGKPEQMNPIAKGWKALNESLVVEKHKHILKQKSWLDATYLRCDCGLVLRWNITKQQYEEEK